MNKTTTQAPSEEDDPLREPFFLEKRKILQSKLKQFHDEVVEHVGLDKQLAHDAAQRVAELVALQAHNAVNHAGHDFSLLISSTYNSTQLAAKSKEPLSLKFIHKPSRAKEFYEKCQDQTKINSMLNSNISPTTELSQNPFTETDEINSETESTSALEISQDDDDADIDEHRLIRKKSGEVLKPLLKDSSVYTYFNRKRTQSLPLTPTYKQVHFGASNVDIRYFKKKDRPAAISASNSPTLAGSPAMKIHNHSNNSSEDEVDEDDDETEYYDDSESDLDLDDELSSELTMNLGKTGNTIFNSGTTDWDLKLPNFPVLSYDDKILVQQSKVFLERMFISIDKKFLLGHIAVKNLKFEKNITVRYTLDNWSTIIEIPTIYVPDVPQILKRNQYDRFIFKIPLNGLFNSVTSATNVNTTTKSFQLCIKYVAEHDEYWDNNNFNNYEFRLTKISKKTKVPVQKLKALESHTAKPKYSSSYLKRRLSDSTLEVHPPPINSPDVFFDYTTSPPTSSRIVGTNNSPLTTILHFPLVPTYLSIINHI